MTPAADPGPPPAGTAAAAANATRLSAAPPLPAAFYRRDATTVARALLGKALVVDAGAGIIAGVVVETEAYLGAVDPASHAYRGETARTRTMFEAGGACYVYLSYGMHVCMNVVTGPPGRAEAVLLRALAPLAGVEAMAANRGMAAAALPGASAAVMRRLANGPGKLTQALGIGLGHDGWRFDRPELKLVAWGGPVRAADVGVSGRIGISKAAELPLRFFLTGSPWLSRTPVGTPHP